MFPRRFFSEILRHEICKSGLFRRHRLGRLERLCCLRRRVASDDQPWNRLTLLRRCQRDHGLEDFDQIRSRPAASRDHFHHCRRLHGWRRYLNRRFGSLDAIRDARASTSWAPSGAGPTLLAGNGKLSRYGRLNLTRSTKEHTSDTFFPAIVWDQKFRLNLGQDHPSQRARSQNPAFASSGPHPGRRGSRHSPTRQTDRPSGAAGSWGRPPFGAMQGEFELPEGWDRPLSNEEADTFWEGKCESSRHQHAPGGRWQFPTAYRSRPGRPLLQASRCSACHRRKHRVKPFVFIHIHARQFLPDFPSRGGAAAAPSQHAGDAW